MFKEDGGVTSVSSSVRRARSRRGTFPSTIDEDFAAAARLPAGRRTIEALADFLRGAGFRVGGRLRLTRLVERRALGRFAARRAGLARFAAFFAFGLFRFAIAFILSEP
jgi:hypothetical protein